MNKDLIIERNVNVKQAMDKLGFVNPKIVFVVENDRLIGSLTDGDVRRYLLNNGKITDSVEKACNRHPKIAKSLEDAKAKYSKEFIAIPIIRKNKIVEVYIGLEKEEEVKKISLPVVINAGGKGTRLEPFTKVLPKPLIPIGEYPILEHIMQRFEKYGCNRFYCIVNYKKQLIKAYFKESDKRYKLTCIDEDIPLGTAGGLSLLKGKINNTFFFVNCDTLLLENYSDIYEHHVLTKSDITIVCANKEIEIPFGVVKIEKNKELKRIIEKPKYSLLTNVGFYVIEPTVLAYINNDTKIDMPNLIKIAKEQGKKITVYPVSEDKWLDMGQLPELEKMRRALYEK